MNTQAVDSKANFSLSHLYNWLFSTKSKSTVQKKPSWISHVEHLLAGGTPRLHNLLWHELRHNWQQLTPAQHALIQQYDWAPERTLEQHGSGEDFLFYSRYLISTVNDWLSPHQTAIASWSNDTQKADSDDLAMRMERIKSDYKYWGALVREYAEVQNTAHLQTLSLDQLGTKLEQIFTKMLVRWNRIPITGFRPNHDVDENWNTPQYNALGDHYSAISNEVFWYLLNWIDHRVQDWFEANKEHLETTSINNIEWYKDQHTFQSLVSVQTPWIGAANASIEHNNQQHQALLNVFNATLQSGNKLPLAS